MEGSPDFSFFLFGCVLIGRGEAQNSGISETMAHFCLEDPDVMTCLRP